jgi:hypothetical protein
MVKTLVAVVCLACAATRVHAQDMEPRAYSASPVGANFLVAGFSRSTGAIVFDPSLPITDVQADVNGWVLGAGHTFSLAGKLGLVTAAVPYAFADVTGQISEAAAETHRSGLADARFKLSVNLRGNDAMAPQAFARAPRRTIVGASVLVSAPSGQYSGSKLINLGTNRWSYKPEIGVAVPAGKWEFDVYGAATIYSANDDFYPGGKHRKQDALYSLQGHASYTFRPRLWVAVNSTWYRGGSARVEDGVPSTSLNNSRGGITVSLPIQKRYSIKIAYTSGIVARTGTNFRTIAVSWQALWLSRRWSGL